MRSHDMSVMCSKPSCRRVDERAEIGNVLDGAFADLSDGDFDTSCFGTLAFFFNQLAREITIKRRSSSILRILASMSLSMNSPCRPAGGCPPASGQKTGT